MLYLTRDKIDRCATSRPETREPPSDDDDEHRTSPFSSLRDEPADAGGVTAVATPIGAAAAAAVNACSATVAVGRRR